MVQTKLFINVNSLFLLHTAFYQQLCTVHKDWDPEKSEFSVAKTIKEFCLYQVVLSILLKLNFLEGPQFKLYVEFINGYNDSIEVFGELMKDKHIAKTIEVKYWFYFKITPSNLLMERVARQKNSKELPDSPLSLQSQYRGFVPSISTIFIYTPFDLKRFQGM